MDTYWVLVTMLLDPKVFGDSAPLGFQHRRGTALPNALLVPTFKCEIRQSIYRDSDASGVE